MSGSRVKALRRQFRLGPRVFQTRANWRRFKRNWVTTQHVETYDIQVDQQRRALWLGPWQLFWHVPHGHGRMMRRGVTAWTR